LILWFKCKKCLEEIFIPLHLLGCPLDLMMKYLLNASFLF